ncbi:MAG: hypothetical protein HW373_1286, partial [Deltaproteobacteria bacterium]|nr:hypothetical protein [Deltaproteobacteria bacterium]
MARLQKKIFPMLTLITGIYLAISPTGSLAQEKY